VQASSELLRKRTAEHVAQLTGQLNAATVALENLTEDAAALKAEKEALEATHATVVRVSPRVRSPLHRRLHWRWGLLRTHEKPHARRAHDALCL
jgi:hypothetical protein